MASPVSIGDAFLLAKLALKLGQTFTTGRKSAPAEFREVESQLYSISTALTALGDACRNNGLELEINNAVLQNPVQNPRGNKGDDALLSMLQGCQDVLKHLEGVVEKYSSIGQPEQSNIPRFQKWKSGVKRNWKKIIWTTEGGDLAALQRMTSVQNTNFVQASTTEPPPPLTEIQFKISARSLRGLEKLDDLQRSESVDQYGDIIGYRKYVLATNNAKAMFRPGCGTTLAYITAGKSQPIEHRILNFLSDLDQVRNKVEKVTFTMNDQSYTRTGITTIKLMHYKSSTREYLSMDYVVDPKDLFPLDTAELEITYTQGSESDIAKSILYITYKTISKRSPNSDSLILENIACAGLTTENQESTLNGINVSIQLKSPEAATLLQRSIQHMREELFVMSLKAPRPGERLALKLEAKGFHTDRVDMADCEISIVQSETSGDLRLIITSKDERTILSQDCK
ncbi:hypothetical protein TWF788_007465 [Orbilia oligospora]|uniref:Fungal N-terminal domain-containing protein n=1 Tax=Orbilia oligospora TaxID=2813651 RepID=A0A7C8PSV7_ORBOL|nr:hypothetical protein TWF788_007465 [Orbilia oligospora]